MIFNELQVKSINEQRGERLRLIRNMLSMTIVEFSNLCGTGESTIRQWEQGRASGLTEKGARKILEASKSTNVEFEIDWLLHNEGMPPRIKQITSDTTPMNTEDLSDELAYFNKTTIKPLIYVLKDDSMHPMFLNDDVVGGCCVDPTEFAKLSNQVVIAQTVDNQMYLRKLSLTNDPSIFILSAINPLTTAEPIILEAKLLNVAYVTRVWRKSPLAVNK